MDFRLDATFFRRAKKLNRAVEITDNHAFIPAVRDSPEIRVPLPNRRLKTMEERQAALDAIMEQIGSLDEQIEVERKQLIELSKRYTLLKSGVAEVVVQNLKIQGLMEKRKALEYPERSIQEIDGVTLKDIFEGKRDMRKVNIFKIKNRVEPITSLYIDLEGISAATSTGTGAATATSSSDEDVEFAPTVQPTVKAKTLEEKKEQAKVGAIVQQKKTIKLKKAATPQAALGGGSASSN
jgi:hypothetical protein